MTWTWGRIAIIDLSVGINCSHCWLPRLWMIVFNYSYQFIPLLSLQGIDARLGLVSNFKSNLRTNFNLLSYRYRGYQLLWVYRYLRRTRFGYASRGRIPLRQADKVRLIWISVVYLINNNLLFLVLLMPNPDWRSYKADMSRWLIHMVELLTESKVRYSFINY